MEIMEHACHPKRVEGRWMRYFDIEVQGSKLKLVDKGVPRSSA